MSIPQITIRDCVKQRFCKVASETWAALCALEREEISKGKALQIIQIEAELLERESWDAQARYEKELQDKIRALEDQFQKAAEWNRLCELELSNLRSIIAENNA